MEHIKMVVLDVDGTLTDGKIYMGDNGEIMKVFNCYDAVALRKLPPMNIETVIITERESKIVTNRSNEMNISEVYQNVSDKKEKLDELLNQKRLSYYNVFYIGDGENDYEAMLNCGFKACPNGASDSIKAICDYISPNKCSEAAVSEIVNKFLINRSSDYVVNK